MHMEARSSEGCGELQGRCVEAKPWVDELGREAGCPEPPLPTANLGVLQALDAHAA